MKLGPKNIIFPLCVCVRAGDGEGNLPVNGDDKLIGVSCSMCLTSEQKLLWRLRMVQNFLRDPEFHDN